MAEETNNAPAAKGGIGHIVRVVGPVVDVEFAPSEMPRSITHFASTPTPLSVTSSWSWRFRCTSLAIWFVQLQCRQPTA